MSRRIKVLMGGALAAAMVLSSAVAAFAEPMLTLVPTKSAITYGQTTWLKVRAFDGEASVPTTVTLQYRTIGSETWTDYRLISSTRTAEGTVSVPVGPGRLKSITGFRALAEGLESDTATVSVKARLTNAIAPVSLKTRHRIVVKGFIWPRHAVGSHPVEVTLWKLESGAWVQQDIVRPSIVGKTFDGAKWQFSRWFTKADKGRWRIQVSHEDAAHARSTSHYTYIRVR